MSNTEPNPHCTYHAEPYTGVFPFTPEAQIQGAYLFFCRDITFDFIEEIKVTYYWQETSGFFLLDKTNPNKILVPSTSTPPPATPLTYNLEYQTINGNYKQNGQTASLINFIYNPFTTRTTWFLPMGMEGKTPYTDRIQLSYYSTERGPDWEIKGDVQQVILSPGHTTCILNYPIVNPQRAAVFYEGTVMNNDGRIKNIPLSASNQSLIPVGFNVAWNAIEVDSSRVNWQIFKSVKVYLHTVSENDSTPSGTESPVGELTFTTSSGSLYWGYLNLNTNIQTFFWKASYYVEDFLDPISTTTQEEPYTGYLMLPKEPSAK